jgi:hypothetical protein
VAQIRAAVLIGLDGFFHERLQRGLAVLGHLVDANDVFVVRLECVGDLVLEGVCGHSGKIKASASKFKVQS